VAASVVYIFIRSMVTLSAVIFLVSPDISLAAVSIMLLVNDGKLNAAAAMSVVVVLVILVVLGIGELLGRAMGAGQHTARESCAK
jgi:iron(III) transport system permease protein